MGEEGDQHLQIEEPAHKVTVTTKKTADKETSLHSTSMNDEEKARQIADQDLKRPLKQVRFPKKRWTQRGNI